MRALVCGGRNYSDRHTLFSVLDVLHLEIGITEIVNGAAPGADTLSTEWAKKNGLPPLPYPVLPEDWKKYGKAAGMIRNQHMFKDSQPHMVVAFPGGPGTAGMIKIVKRAGYRTLIDSEDFKVFLRPTS